jgi:hypothetical protein
MLRKNILTIFIFNYLDSFLSGEQFMYDDLGNRNLIVVLSTGLLWTTHHEHNAHNELLHWVI